MFFAVSDCKGTTFFLICKIFFDFFSKKLKISDLPQALAVVFNPASGLRYRHW
jgi:hypothetical protein